MVESKKLESTMAELRRGKRELEVRERKNREREPPPELATVSEVEWRA
jgi:hypothetical protein